MPHRLPGLARRRADGQIKSAEEEGAGWPACRASPAVGQMVRSRAPGMSERARRPAGPLPPSPDGQIKRAWEEGAGSAACRASPAVGPTVRSRALGAGSGSPACRASPAVPPPLIEDRLRFGARDTPSRPGLLVTQVANERERARAVPSWRTRASSGPAPRVAEPPSRRASSSAAPPVRHTRQTSGDLAEWRSSAPSRGLKEQIRATRCTNDGGRGPAAAEATTVLQSRL